MNTCGLGQGCKATSGMSPYDLWQGYEATIWVMQFAWQSLDHISFNELIFGLQFRINSLSK
jgi:hypothetical protein